MSLFERYRTDLVDNETISPYSPRPSRDGQHVIDIDASTTSTRTSTHARPGRSADPSSRPSSPEARSIRRSESSASAMRTILLFRSGTRASRPKAGANHRRAGIPGSPGTNGYPSPRRSQRCPVVQASGRFHQLADAQLIGVECRRRSKVAGRRPDPYVAQRQRSRVGRGHRRGARWRRLGPPANS